MFWSFVILFFIDLYAHNSVFKGIKSEEGQNIIVIALQKFKSLLVYVMCRVLVIPSVKMLYVGKSIFNHVKKKHEQNIMIVLSKLKSIFVFWYK